MKKKNMSKVGPLSGCFTPFNRKKKTTSKSWKRSRSVFDLGANCTFTLHSFFFLFLSFKQPGSPGRHFQRWGALKLHGLQRGASADGEPDPRRSYLHSEGVINSKELSALFACLNIYAAVARLAQEAATIYGAGIDFPLWNNSWLLMTKAAAGPREVH